MYKNDLKNFEGVFVAIARELIELTGESPSSVYSWIQQHDKLEALTGTRQTFYNRVKRDWTRKSPPTQTRDYRLCSRPLACELRLRAVSLWCQFRQDVRAERYRQVVILAGYERCTRMFHFRLYRCSETGTEANAKDLACGIHHFEVADFVRECGGMLGLPLRRVVLTQALVAGRAMDLGYAPFCDFKERSFFQLKELGQRSDGRLPISEATAPAGHQEGEGNITEWLRSFSTAQFMEALNRVTNLHNRRVAAPLIKKAREKLGEMKQSLEDSAGRSRWGSPVLRRQNYPLLVRLDKTPWLAGEEICLREMSRVKRAYREFTTVPGDT